MSVQPKATTMQRMQFTQAALIIICAAFRKPKHISAQSLEILKSKSLMWSFSRNPSLQAIKWH